MKLVSAMGSLARHGFAPINGEHQLLFFAAGSAGLPSPASGCSRGRGKSSRPRSDMVFYTEDIP